MQISFNADDGLDISGQLRTAQALFDAERQWQYRIELFAVGEKLSLANDWGETRVFGNQVYRADATTTTVMRERH